MSKPFHIILLEFIATNGMGMPVDISNFIAVNFINSTNPPVELILTGVIILLDDLERREFIAQDKEDNGMWEQLEGDNSITIKWMSFINTNNELFYYITSEGLDYLDRYKTNELNNSLTLSFKDNNTTTKKNSKIQIGIGVVTLIVAFSSVYISYLTYHKTDTTSVSVDSLRKELRLMREQQIKQPIQIEIQKSSVMDFPHKH